MLGNNHYRQVEDLTNTEKQWVRFCYSLADFRESNSSLVFLMEECDHDTKYDYITRRRFRCYENNMVLSYSRPFNQSKGNIPQFLSLKKTGVRLPNSEKDASADRSHLTQEEVDIHEKILRVRNRLVAHSDMDLAMLGVHAFDLGHHLEGLKFPYLKQPDTLHFDRSQLNVINSLITKLIRTMSAVIFETAQEHPDFFDFIYEKGDIYKSSRS